MSSIKTSKIVPLSSALTIESETTVVAGKLSAGGTAGNTPNAPLQVYGATTVQGASNRGVFLASNANNSRQVQIGINDTSNIGWIEGWIPGTGSLKLSINPSGGYVGIGTASPAVALDVSGEARSSTSTTSASNAKTLTTKDYVEDYVDSKCIGVGQTWQVFARNAAGRVANTNYTNSTGKPIMVFITSVDTGGFGSSGFAIDDVIMSSAGYDDGPNYGGAFVSFIVPNGSTYKHYTTSSTQATYWAELR